MSDIVPRGTPAPWAEADHLPWDDPEFSRAMLKEHLSQEHDAASRRAPTIDGHVRFIHQQVLGGKPAHVLDLGCGPGLYLERLARLGHSCRGIDFSPASIAYAREIAATEGLSISYTLGDLRSSELGTDQDLVMLLYGEFNVFRPADARSILRSACAALKSGGRLLLEPSPEEHIRHLGVEKPGWYASAEGLFSPRPHLVLHEAFWCEESKACARRWYVLDAATAEVKRYAASYQAYSDDEYRGILEECGFGQVTFFPSLLGEGTRATDVIAIAAARA